jgi:4a-hydroxytetrahydrobiopterin dehydratase
MTRLLTHDEVAHALLALPGWAGGTEDIGARYLFPSFAAAISAVVAVADEADTMDHHPDIDIRYRRVSFLLSTHSAGGVTQLDVELAHRIATAAAAAGGSAAG